MTPKLPRLPQQNPAPQPTVSRGSTATTSNDNWFISAIIVAVMVSLGYLAGYENGAHTHNQTAPVAAEQTTGHRGAKRPGTGNNGLLTGP